jgi:hypothetical protein
VDVRPVPTRHCRTLAFVTALVAACALAGNAAATPPPGHKVSMCHHTSGKGGTHTVTIVVDAAAVPAHVKHGDIAGACPHRAPDSSSAVAKAKGSGASEKKAAQPAGADKKTKPAPPDGTAAPGNSGGDHGQSGDDHGHAGDPPGKADNPPQPPADNGNGGGNGNGKGK